MISVGDGDNISLRCGVGEIYAKDRARKTTYKKKRKLGQRELTRRFCIDLMIFS